MSRRLRLLVVFPLAIAVTVGLAYTAVELLRGGGGRPRERPRPETGLVRTNDADAATEAPFRQEDDRPAATPSPPRAGPQEGDALDRAFVEAYGAPTRALVREAFEEAVGRAFPRERLSSDEIERASDALYRLRETRIALRELPMTEEHAEERRILIEDMNEATESFSSVMDMDPAAFTERAAEGVESTGIDRDDEDEAYVPDADYLKDRR